LLGLPRIPEQVTALKKTKLMVWPAADIGNIAQTRPRLALQRSFLANLSARPTT
jgi:hypothetical protein